MSGSKSLSVLVCFRNGKLALGVVTNFLTTLASHNVASLSSLSTSSSRLKFLKEGGVMDSVRGMFSLSELIQSGSSKNLGLYLCSVRLGHSPESEVMLLSFSGESIPLEAFGEPVSHLLPVSSKVGTFQSTFPCLLLKCDCLYGSWP